MLRRLKQIQPRPLVIAFWLPFMSWMIAMIATSQYPFGDNAIIYSDCLFQYYPFFLELRDAIRSGSGLQWSWALGMGTDYIGLIAYYCTSPLYWPSILMPQSWLLTYFCLLPAIKVSLASLSMAFFLTKFTSRGDKALPLFSAIYGLCSWSLIFFINIMWVDILIMLPLVTWGTILLLREKRIIPYIGALAATLIINYYMAIFVCMFVFLLYFCYQFCKPEGIKKFGTDFVRIGICTILSFCLAAIVFLPTLEALSNSFSSQQGTMHYILPQVFFSGNEQESAITAWNTVRNIIHGEAESPLIPAISDAIRTTIPLVKEAASITLSHAAFGTYRSNAVAFPPTIYCGIATIILVFIGLLTKTISRKEKIAYISLVAIYALGFFSTDISYVYHGFHHPAGFPFRFTFILSFISITTAYRVWLQREDLLTGQVLLSGLMVAGYLCLSAHFRTSGVRDVNLFLIAFFILGLLPAGRTPRIAEVSERPIIVPDAEYTQIDTPPESNNTAPQEDQKQDNFTKSRRRMAAVLTVSVMLIEIILSPVFASVYHSSNARSASQIEKTTTSTRSLIASIEDADPFYRTETIQPLSFNDGALYNIHSPSIFSSTVNQNTTKFLISLGADGLHKNNRAIYGNGSSVSNLFLGIKYMVNTNGEAVHNSLFELVSTGENGTALYRNTAYLPLGFLVGEEVLSLTFDVNERDSFDFQNQLFSAATGVTENVYQLIDPAAWQFNGSQDISLDMRDPGQVVATSTSKAPFTVSATGTACSDGILTLHISTWNVMTPYTVYKNEVKVYSGEVTDRQHMVTIGDVAAGDEIRVDVTHPEQETEIKPLTLQIYGAILDKQMFLQGHEALSRNTLQVTNFSSTYVAGTVYCDNDSLLYTSIPQNGYWRIYVDGEKTTPILLGNTMICLNLTEGSHTIELRYRNNALMAGIAISGTTLTAIVAYLIIKKRHNKTKDAPAVSHPNIADSTNDPKEERGGSQ